MTPAATGFLGLAVLVVMLQSSGGFTVELLGPNLLLAVSGFVVTRSLLDSAAATGRIDPLTWYREQLTLNTPLLLVVPLAVLAVAASVGPYLPGGQTVYDLVDVLVPTGNWWELVGQTERTDRIDPLGTLWIIGLLVQFCLVWPSLLAVLHRLTGARDARRMLRILTPLLLAMAVAAWLVGPLRDRAGADLAELAMGGHARAVEWLIGATAAAATAGLRSLPRLVSRWEAPALAVVGGGLLVAMAVLATTQPAEWLRHGGPGAAACGAAILLLAVHVPADGPLARALGQGFPVELGRMAFPLLVLHSLVFWSVQLAVPEARPIALLAVGGALSWLIGLILQDGIVRRVRRARLRWPRVGAPAMVAAGVALVVVAVLAGNRVITVANAVPTTSGRPGTPTVLVLGGAYAGNIAAVLDRPGARYEIADGSRPGCGLIDTPARQETVNSARTTTLAQLPGAVPQCRDWARTWTNRIAAVRPDAIVIDLTTDAKPRSDARAEPLPSPCSPAFRALYRPLVADAVRVAAEGAGNRPVLLTTGHRDIPGLRVVPGVDDGTRRCFNALLVETAASYRTVYPLPLDAGLAELPGELTAELDRLAPGG
jgi:peptidoglycan/LPS O-acetylase OafA/YrhL